MSKTLCRLGIIVVCWFLLLELYYRLEVSLAWRESTAELIHILQILVLWASAIWVAWPAVSNLKTTEARALCRMVTVLVVIAGVWTGSLVYYRTVLPALGWHEDPPWYKEIVALREENKRNSLGREAVSPGLPW